MENSARLAAFHGGCAPPSASIACRDPGPLPAREFVPPNDGKRTDRYDRDQLLACSRGEMFGAGNAQLPRPPLLMIDRIRHISRQGGSFDRGEIIGELDIAPDLWFFAAHFHGDPVMPGCFTLDALWQLLGFYIAWSGGLGRGRALGVGQVRISGPVIPEHRLVTYRVHIRKLIARPSPIAIADGRVDVDGVTIYTANSLRVGLFPSPSINL
jgi:3-hydroxyacyl-[acyl-carrier protein] dehydratase/trans-2-decenoyl-[acyl-carrier protein] isomerase